MNIYYNPEKYGLEPVGAIDWNDEPYEFDMTAVWKDERDRYYYASDAGCSCPTPFEDFHSLSDLNGPYSKSEAKASVTRLLDDRSFGGYYFSVPRAKIVAQISQIFS